MEINEEYISKFKELHRIMEKLLVYDPKKKKIVLTGYYDYNHKVFFKICSAKHYMIKEKSYGISEEIIQRLQQFGCNKIEIHTKTITLISNFGDWLKRKPKDYGHGLQRFLPIGQMRNVNEN